jgi:hypothetical protein
MQSERLPPMKSVEDASATSKKQRDPFYLNAFMFQAWLGDLIVQAAAEYAEKKNPKDRLIQSGQAWQGFQKLFGHVEDQHLPSLLEHLFRFAECDDPMSALLQQAIFPLSIEDQCTGEYFAGASFNVDDRSSAGLSKSEAAKAKRSLARRCDWLDALIHFRTHQQWHLAPETFDMDPDKRELAALGVTQRHLGQLDESARARWVANLADAADRFKDSPKWMTLGRAMSASTDLPWPYAEVDAVVIGLWPLVKQYNWTYRDLLNVIRPGLQRPDAYPCDTDQNFATYCGNVMGLRKTGRGRTAKTGKPKGHDIALGLLGLNSLAPRKRK